MSSKRPIILALSDWQVQELQGLFDRVSRSRGRNGALPLVVAQVFPDGMRVGYMAPAKATALIRAMGKEPGKSERTSAFGRARRTQNPKLPSKEDPCR